MKNKICIILSIFIVTVLFGTCEKENSSPLSAEENLDKDASYALGMSVGAEFLQNMTSGQISPNINEFVKGLGDIMKGNTTRFTADEASEVIERAFASIMEERNVDYMLAENAFLAENARKPGVIITSSGLQYEIITEGTGPKPSINDEVKVHYQGTLADGQVFDSSYSRGTPVDFYLSQVIPGWSEGLQLMNVGSHFRFYVPSELGYGPSGMMQVIPPYATLIFEVELLEIN